MMCPLGVDAKAALLLASCLCTEQGLLLAAASRAVYPKLVAAMICPLGVDARATFGILSVLSKACCLLQPVVLPIKTFAAMMRLLGFMPALLLASWFCTERGLLLAAVSCGVCPRICCYDVSIGG